VAGELQNTARPPWDRGDAGVAASAAPGRLPSRGRRPAARARRAALAARRGNWPAADLLLAV